MNGDELGRSSHVVLIGGTDKKALLNALLLKNVRLNQAAQDLFADPRFTVSSTRTIVEIAICSVGQMGFSDGATYRQLVERAVKSGLAECPLELGPHWRKPRNPVLITAS